MAGSWLKVESSTPEKTEVLAITVAMGWDDPDLTVGKLFRVWRWFDEHTIDGNAARVTSALLDRIAGVTGFCQAMADVGWLELTDQGLSLPNFDRHNGKTAKDRALTAKRVATHKGNAAANGEGNAPIVSDALPREEKKRKEKIKKSANADSSAEQDSAPDAPPAAMLPLIDGTEHLIAAALLDEWSAAFPALDVDTELQRMRVWLITNPRNRKTSRGVNAFVTSWLSRSQDRAPRSGGQHNTAGAMPNRQEALEARNREVAERFARSIG